MEIRTEVKTEQVKTEIKVIYYSRDEVERLILSDIASKGYSVAKISFDTSYKHTSDEWGMNTGITSIFNGASAIVQ